MSEGGNSDKQDKDERYSSSESEDEGYKPRTEISDIMSKYGLGQSQNTEDGGQQNLTLQ